MEYFTPKDENNQRKTSLKDNETEHISLADRFLIAMFGPRDYKKILKDSVGTVAAYLCILVLLLSLIHYAIPVLARIAGNGGVKNIIMQQIPTFHLQNGELELDDVYEVKDEASGIYVIADTSVEEYTQADVPANYMEAIMISKTNTLVYNRMAGLSGTSQSTKHSVYGTGEIDNEILADNAWLIYLCMIWMFLFMYVLEFGKYMLAGLGFTVLFFIFANVIMAEISFGKLYKTSLYAQTIGALVYAVASCIYMCVGSDILILAASLFEVLVTMGIIRRVVLQSIKKVI